jgi:hypothetical protein
MKKIKYHLATALIILGVCSAIFMIGYIKYKFWRAVHPQAKTWLFFIPKGNR